MTLLMALEVSPLSKVIYFDTRTKEFMRAFFFVWIYGDEIVMNGGFEVFLMSYEFDFQELKRKIF